MLRYRETKEGEVPLKIVALTGHVEEEFIKKASDCGMDEVLSKPIQIRNLAKLLLDYGFIDEIPNHILRN